MYAYITPHTHTFRAEVLTGRESAMPGDLQHAFENHLFVAPSRGPGHTVQAWHQVGVPGGLREARWLTEVSRAKGQVLASCFLKVARAKPEKMNWHHDHKEESSLERSGRKCVQKHSRSQEESEKIQGTDSSGSRCVWGASWFHFQLLDANAQQGHVLPFTLSLHLAKEIGKAGPESHRHCGLSSPGGEEDSRSQGRGTSSGSLGWKVLTPKVRTLDGGMRDENQGRLNRELEKNCKWTRDTAENLLQWGNIRRRGDIWA